MPGNPWWGSSGNDTIAATWGVYHDAATPPGPSVKGNGGNDLIIRDWTGYYEQDNAGNWMDMSIQGGNGEDTVMYSLSTTAVSATLESIFGYGLASSPATSLGVDRLYSIENLGGSQFDDTLEGSSENNRLYGFDGSDLMSGGGGNDSLYAHLGDDTVNGEGGNDLVDGYDGDDVINGGSGSDTLYGGDDDDTIDGGFQSDLIFGGEGNDEIEGGRGNDTIDAGDGHDVIDAGQNHDEVHVGDGADTVDLGGGGDTVFISGFGNNTIDGDWGNDTAVFESNSAVNVNLVFGFADRGVEGTDSLVNIENVETGNGNDTVVGSAADNEIDTGNGADYVYGYHGDDTVYAGSHNDTVDGGQGEDMIFGSFGADSLNGNTGHDTINGGSSSDTIRGGEGEDYLTGGSFGDTFVYEAGDHGIDTITDFNLASDKIFFGEDFLATNNVGQTDLDDVLLAWAYGDGNSILAVETADNGWEFLTILHNVSVQELNAQIVSEQIFEVEGEIGGVVTQTAMAVDDFMI